MPSLTNKQRLHIALYSCYEFGKGNARFSKSKEDNANTICGVFGEFKLQNCYVLALQQRWLCFCFSLEETAERFILRQKRNFSYIRQIFVLSNNI